MERIRGRILSLLLFLLTGLAKGGVIYNGFGPGDGYLACCGWGSVYPAQLAYSFTAGESVVLDRIELALSRGIGSDHQFDIVLMDDQSNSPGLPLESFHFADVLGPMGNINPLIVAISTLHPLLQSGAQFWVMMAPTLEGNGVNWNDGGLTKGAARVNADRPWTVGESALGGAFRISGNPITSDVPEPGSAIIVGPCLLIFAVRLRRHFFASIE
jgi:hypothetical protein